MGLSILFLRKMILVPLTNTEEQDTAPPHLLIWPLVCRLPPCEYDHPISVSIANRSPVDGCVSLSLSSPHFKAFHFSFIIPNDDICTPSGLVLVSSPTLLCLPPTIPFSLFLVWSCTAFNDPASFLSMARTWQMAHGQTHRHPRWAPSMCAQYTLF